MLWACASLTASTLVASAIMALLLLVGAHGMRTY